MNDLSQSQTDNSIGKYTDNALIIEKNGKKGIGDFDGKVLAKPAYYGVYSDYIDGEFGYRKTDKGAEYCYVKAYVKC